MEAPGKIKVSYTLRIFEKSTVKMLDFVIENFKVSRCNSLRTCVERREGPQFGNSKNYPILKIRRAYVPYNGYERYAPLYLL